jgi:hypothetical protein
MIDIDYKIYQAGICTYTDTFYAFIPWLKLNGIKYMIEETDLYSNGLVIKIFKGETKQQRRLIYHYMNTIFPSIRDRIRR